MEREINELLKEAQLKLNGLPTNGDDKRTTKISGYYEGQIKAYQTILDLLVK